MTGVLVLAEIAGSFLSEYGHIQKQSGSLLCMSAIVEEQAEDLWPSK